MTHSFPLRPIVLAGLVALTTLTGCAVGPDYQRASAPVPAQYKELGDWQIASPQDDQARDSWWQVYQDPVLDQLVAQIALSNQNIQAYAAQYRQALALLGLSQAAYFPTVGASLGSTRTQVAPSSVSAGSPAASNTTPITKLGLSASWEPDLWGGIRRSVESSQASAQASLAQLQSATLSAQATLVQTYFQLRTTDLERQLLDDTTEAYERSLQITQNRYEAGVAAQLDVAQAQTQLETARAQAIDLRSQRAQLEHAIAVLVGQAPADFQLVPNGQLAQPVLIPLAQPSQLLERRPDIAAAERRMAAANAQIGVAQSAYFPALTLGASNGFQGTSGLSQLTTAPNHFWSVGPQLAMTLFDGGARSAQTDSARANYENTVATYRQTVLSAFQEVEDNLAANRYLEQEAKSQALAMKSAQTALDIANNQYQAGTTSYLSVVTAQATALSAQKSYFDVTYRKLVANVTLLKAMGGGWDTPQP